MRAPLQGLADWLKCQASAMKQDGSNTAEDKAILLQWAKDVALAQAVLARENQRIRQRKLTK